MTRPRLGVWIDEAIDKIDDRLAARLRQCGFTEAAIMTTKQGAPNAELRAKPATFGRAAFALRSAGITDVVLTVWPRPRTRHLDELDHILPAVIDETDPCAIEVDCEGNWLKNQVQGFTNLDGAARSLHHAMLEWALRGRDANDRRRLEMTTYPYHSENGPTASLAPLVDLVLPQAYSVSERAGQEVRWDSSYGPGRMQGIAVQRAREAKPKALGLGLAAYEQRFRGHETHEAMNVAYEAALSANPQTIRWWSSLNITRNSDMEQWFKTLA